MTLTCFYFNMFQIFLSCATHFTIFISLHVMNKYVQSLVDYVSRDISAIMGAAQMIMTYILLNNIWTQTMDGQISFQAPDLSGVQLYLHVRLSTQKMGDPTNRGITRNTASCSLLLKKNLQLLFYMCSHQKFLQ